MHATRASTRGMGSGVGSGGGGGGRVGRPKELLSDCGCGSLVVKLELDVGVRPVEEAGAVRMEDVPCMDGFRHAAAQHIARSGKQRTHTRGRHGRRP